MYSLLFEEKRLLKEGIDAYLARIDALEVFNGFEIGFSEDRVQPAVLTRLSSLSHPLSFHIPDHEADRPYRASDLASDPDAVKRTVGGFLDFAHALAQTDHPVITVHLSEDGDPEKNTRYLDVLLEWMGRRGQGGILALENLWTDRSHYPVRLLNEYLERFSTPQLGLCLDLTHLLVSGESTPDIHPVHCHFHGFALSERHTALTRETWGQFLPLLERFSSVARVFELLDRSDYNHALDISAALMKRHTV